MKPVVLILGAGPNIGHHVARAFAANGYKVAPTSRRPPTEDNSTTNQIHIQSDLSDLHSVAGVFARVKQSLGIPSVVIYNAAAATSNEDKNPLSLPLADFTRDLNINTTSAFVAAQEATLAFAELPDSTSRTYIYTGNVLNTTTIPSLLSLGVGKSATAHIIQSAAAAYSDRGFKFYYTDERKPDGAPAYFDVDGEAHAKFYLKLAGGKSQGPWLQTFVKGVGYKSF
ncbi:putative short-chain dehydrogenase [Aspergillus karnatakaensis]|uniref:SDR family oxidoreductase n=1 Tax=Aspergillus karnatakaensis TaxID=1810916 RepID=UPI003CCD17E0